MEGVEGSSESLPAAFAAGERASCCPRCDMQHARQGGPTRKISYPSEIARTLDAIDSRVGRAGRELVGGTGNGAGRLFQNGRLRLVVVARQRLDAHSSKL
jgi:hypothetical protein